MFFFLLFTLGFADAVYFSMSDIRVTIPIDKGKLPSLPSEKHPLVTLFTQGEAPLKYSILHGKDKYFKISNGDVSFSKKFFQSNNITSILIEMDQGSWINVSVADMSTITAKISVQDSKGTENRTSFKLEILPLKSFDCDFIVEDLCFWKSARYRINENTKSARIGSLASPYLVEMCATYQINYNLVSKNEEFRIVSEGLNRFIESTEPLDREIQSNYTLEVLCTVENPQGAIRNISKTLFIKILDVDDNAPQPQEDAFEVKLASNFITKDQTVDNGEIIFIDKDTLAVNQLEPSILNDFRKIVKPNCALYEDDRDKIQTVIHCKLKFTRNLSMENWTYSVMLQLNDTTLINGTKTVSIPIHLHFPNESGYHPALHKNKLKQPHLYPSNTVKVFRTAAPLARLTQPPTKNINSAKKFKIASSDYKAQVFNVTDSGGILFVHDAAELRKAPEILRVNITWIQNNSVKFDEIEVHVVDEPTKTCSNVGSSLGAWHSCSEHANPTECYKACAISTGGSYNVKNRENSQRCTWRGDINPTERSTIYSTCTPDKDTCPDGICDALEDLHQDICPQDCTRRTSFPTKLSASGRGIDKATGVCTCFASSCHCNTPDYIYIESTSKKPSLEKTTINPTSLLQPNVSKHTGNFTKKILGLELAHCGTSCVLGIVAGALFLGGAVALIVICWRLDRVNKAVRNKFNDESQDLSTPLSNYIDRSMPEPLPLNFDMTTSLADTAILSIINKYAPDPKWEFPRDQLVIEQTLGEGEFGKVLRAKATNIAGQPGLTTVAVKTLKDDARESELNDLLSEYQLLKEVSHPNVIRLLGVCTAPGGPIYLIIEFAEHGSLRNYLRRSRHLKSESGRLPSSTVLDENDAHYDEPSIAKVTPKEILSFAWQICKGMAYLSEIKLVHRDLAARNVLLAADRICKISDFGLTRDIYEDDAYFKRSKGRVPVKWMAPESLSDHVYTNKSDVWSFGILVWELITLGATPYPGIAVQNLFHLLRQGYRMERPDNCSPTLYNIMRSCWHIDPEQRPTFQELSSLWEKMLSDEVEYLDLANNAIHNRSYFCSPFEDGSVSDPSEKSETNPLNYLSKSQSYIKCGSADKFAENSNFLKEPDNNQNDISTQGYETPVKIPKKVQTPSNDSPQYYTDMASGRTN